MVKESKGRRGDAEVGIREDGGHGTMGALVAGGDEIQR